MTKILRISILLLIFQLCSFPAGADISTSTSPILISVKTDRPVITTLEQPVFTVTFQNKSNHTVTLYNADVYWPWKAVFYRLDGTPEHEESWLLGYKIRGLIRPISVKELKSGEKLDVLVDLNHLQRPAVSLDYLFNIVHPGAVILYPEKRISHLEPGRYRMDLTVTLNDHPANSSNDVWSGPGNANSIEFIVVPASNTK